MIRFLTASSFLMLLVCGIVIPSDSNHGFFAPKSLAFLSSIFFFGLYCVSVKEIKKSLAIPLVFLLASVTFLGIWYLVGIDQSPLIASASFDQFKVFLPTLFVPIAGWCLIKEEVVTADQILKVIIYSNLAYSLVKVTLMALHVFGIIHLWSFMESTGLRFMSMPIAGDIGRIQTSVDIATPFLVYFALQGPFSTRFKWFYCLISTLSVFLSFSRFLMAAFAASILLYIFSLGWKNQMKLAISAFIFCLAGVLIAGPENVSEVIDKRFFSQETHVSDRTRQVQIDALMDGCVDVPFLGKGLGGYTTECIRDYNIPHAYEVQWAAFLLQFGLIGILFLLVPIGYIALRLNLSYFLLFSLWLLSGFTNPFLISLTSGVIYLVFLQAKDMKV